MIPVKSDRAAQWTEPTDLTERELDDWYEDQDTEDQGEFVTADGGGTYRHGHVSTGWAAVPGVQRSDGAG